MLQLTRAIGTRRIVDSAIVPHRNGWQLARSASEKRRIVRIPGDAQCRAFLRLCCKCDAFHVATLSAILRLALIKFALDNKGLASMPEQRCRYRLIFSLF